MVKEEEFYLSSFIFAFHLQLLASCNLSSQRIFASFNSSEVVGFSSAKFFFCSVSSPSAAAHARWSMWRC